MNVLLVISFMIHSTKGSKESYKITIKNEVLM
jgi:hypothetical protein